MFTIKDISCLTVVRGTENFASKPKRQVPVTSSIVYLAMRSLGVCPAAQLIMTKTGFIYAYKE